MSNQKFLFMHLTEDKNAGKFKMNGGSINSDLENELKVAGGKQRGKG